MIRKPFNFASFGSNAVRKVSFFPGGPVGSVVFTMLPKRQWRGYFDWWDMSRHA
jgi:hypothetical protein